MFSTYTVLLRDYPWCMTSFLYALKNRKSIYGFPTQNLLTLYLNNFLLHKQLVNIVTIMSYYTIYCNILGVMPGLSIYFLSVPVLHYLQAVLSIKILTFSCTCISYTIL